MNSSSTTPRLTLFAAALAAALVLAAAALGATRPDDRAGIRGPGAVSGAAQVVDTPLDFSSRPDNRAGALGVAAAGATAEAVSAVADDRFDWASAGIGAGAAAGVLMLLGVAALIAVPRRHHGRATV